MRWKVPLGHTCSFAEWVLVKSEKMVAENSIGLYIVVCRLNFGSE